MNDEPEGRADRRNENGGSERTAPRLPTRWTVARGLAALVACVLLSNAIPARAQVPVTEVLNGSDETVLRLHEDGALLGLGTFDTGAIPVEGAGTRLMWYPAKAAFRAGRVGTGSSSDGTEWDAANVGDYSVAMGVDVTASGDEAVALGSGATASGFRATAMGIATTASGPFSTTMGASTEASDLGATAMGFFTTAATSSSLSIGAYNDANQESDGTLFVVGNGAGSVRSDALVLDDDGNLEIAGTLSESSDRRLKTEIESLGADVLSQLDRIRPVRFRFREGTGHPTDRQIGLIAQEVQPAFPELVREGSAGHLSLSYAKLSAVLVKGLQEQQAQIERLRANQTELEALRAENTSIEKRLAKLERRDPRRAALPDSPWTAGVLLVGAVVLGGLLARWRTSSRAGGATVLVGLAVIGALLLLARPAPAQTLTVRNDALVTVDNGGTLDLGTATRLEETDGARITGGTGVVRAVRVLDDPFVNVAGLGAIVRTTAHLGETVVVRGHQVQSAPDGNTGIKRYYEIAPAHNSDLDATLTFSYDDAELGGLKEETLVLFRSTDGGETWTPEGGSGSIEENTITLAGIDAFSRWTLASRDAPLPVEFIRFEIRVDEEEAILSWETASEADNVGFEVERRRGSEEEWTQIGFLEGAGTSTEPQTYRFEDADLPFEAETLVYRLKQVDTDGASQFSEEIEVTRDTPERLVLHPPFPNPFAGQATIRYALPRASSVHLAVYDALGRRVAVLMREEQPAGRKEFTVDARRLRSGLYFVRLTSEGASRTRKMTVVR